MKHKMTYARAGAIALLLGLGLGIAGVTLAMALYSVLRDGLGGL